MSTITTVPAHLQRVHHPLRPWLIGLGWLGLALWVLELASAALRLELVDSVDLRFALHLLRASFGWLWLVAAGLHLRDSTVWAPLRYTLMGIAGFLIVPALLGSLMLLAVGWIGHDVNWQDEQLLYESLADTDVRVVVQSRDDGFATSYPQHRIVKLTPVLGLWQFAEPVDTSAFTRRGWKRKY